MRCGVLKGLPGEGVQVRHYWYDRPREWSEGRVLEMDFGRGEAMIQVRTRKPETSESRGTPIGSQRRILPPFLCVPYSGPATDNLRPVHI